MSPVVPGFIITGEMRTTATGSECVAIRSVDGHRFLLRTLPVANVARAQVLAAQQQPVYDRIDNEHLVRRHGTFALADGRLAVVLDEVNGGSLVQLLGARGQLTVGETVTIVAPLFRALDDLHAAGVTHGDLAPGNVVFTSDGRPLLADVGLARLLGEGTAQGEGVGALETAGADGFRAPEVTDDSEPSAVSDVYAMAALGWFCLTGAPPAPAAQRPPLTTLRPETPGRLVAVLTACLATNPEARPTAGDAAVEVFDAAPAESVALASLSDPAAEITRRIRATAPPVSTPAPSLTWANKAITLIRANRPTSAIAGTAVTRGTLRTRGASVTAATRRSSRSLLAVGVVAILVAVACGVGATLLLRRPPAALQPVVDKSRTQSGPQVSTTHMSTTRRLTPAWSPLRVVTAPTTTPAAARTTVAPTLSAKSSTEVVTASSSPRMASAALLQALVDARALAYVARDSALLNLVYAPAATKADVDRGNIAAALKNGGTYLGLSFVIKDAAFLDGTSDTARIRATILTPAYQSGQPDGRRLAHGQEILGPCVFSLSLTPDGWRILALTAP